MRHSQPVALVLLLAAALWTSTAVAQEEPFKAGEHYLVIDSPRTIGDGENIEIVDIFWYGCPHCYTFLPKMHDWYEANSERVDLVRLPALINRGWRTHAQAYYTAKTLGKADELHSAIFHRIHRDGRPLNQRKDLREFFQNHGVDPEDFDSAWESFAVNSYMSRAERLNEAYGVRGTPAVVVNGRYLMAPSMAGSYEEAFQLLEYLIEREEQRLASE